MLSACYWAFRINEALNLIRRGWAIDQGRVSEQPPEIRLASPRMTGFLHRGRKCGAGPNEARTWPGIGALLSSNRVRGPQNRFKLLAPSGWGKNDGR